jgi:hypothetical protein
MAKAKKTKTDKQKELEPEKKKKQWRQELQHSEAVQNYLSGFNDVFANAFVDHYLEKKVHWCTNPELNAAINEETDLRWITAAFAHFEVILQKKLFDIQCLWRAEKIILKEVEITGDFDIWENNVFNCPFIEPVNEADIEMYTQYLQQNINEVKVDAYFEWQYYLEIKEAYNTDDAEIDFPGWYDFHNGRTGNGTLMLLPDIRGDKEQFYVDLHFDIHRIAAKLAKTSDKRPGMDFTDDDLIKWFVNTFEDKNVQRAYNNYSRLYKDDDMREKLELMTDELLLADEFVSIEAHYDWYEALENALNRYRCKKIAEAMPIALEQYQMNIEMGISFSEKRKRDFPRDAWMEQILNGRRLNGEPEDLNF